MRRIKIPRGAVWGAVAILLLLAAFTVYANLLVDRQGASRIYTDVRDIPYCRVGLLLGVNPADDNGVPNTIFNNRVKAAAELYKAGKIDWIIASGACNSETYDEPATMRDSLIALGVPPERIARDVAGIRTLDSMIRAKEVFGCDTVTVISQRAHVARALALADAGGIIARGMAAQEGTQFLNKLYMQVREWFARDKMMWDILIGKRPAIEGNMGAVFPSDPLFKEEMGKRR